VIVPARVARLIDREIGAKRAANRGLDREITEVLEAIHLAGLEYVSAYDAALSAPVSVTGNGSLPPAAEEPRSDRADQLGGLHTLDTAAVAAALGCTPRNVRWLAINGRLAGSCVSGRWAFAPEVVDGYLAEKVREL
jgi:hypothetical protein